MKNSNDTIGNRSRDLPVCIAVSQPLRHRDIGTLLLFLSSSFFSELFELEILDLVYGYHKNQLHVPTGHGDFNVSVQIG
jgi:hypothetical protein